MKDFVCIGWDVGGMHGANNALAIIKTSPDKIITLKSFKKPKSAESLAQNIAAEIISIANTFETTLLAIDAPLSFPNKFIEQMQNLNCIKPLDFSTQMQNPLAYRASESYLFSKTKKRPLSSTFDQLTSLTLLVQRVFQILKDEHKNIKLLPFDSQNIGLGINAFECYPGNLKTGKTERTEQIEFWKYAHIYLPKTDGEHEKDALLCALFAAFEMEKPEAHRFNIESDFKDKASLEGWIYGFY
ncbi:MAG: hypothetical protein ACPGLV_16315 [Bacteroidia bacterium]